LTRNQTTHDVTDRGIEKAEETMKEALKPITEHNATIRENMTPHAPRADENNSGKTGPEAADQAGTTPFVGQKDTHSAAVKDVNPEAVRESFKEAQLDPVAETEPEEGEAA
jgi:hypothetical protein